MSPAFAAKHTGMRICLSGALNATGKGSKFIRSELERHIEMMGREYYNGNTEMVDIFLQLYCIAETEREDALALLPSDTAEPAKQERKIVQISSAENRLESLCNDGTVWRINDCGTKWIKYPPIPQDAV